MKKLSLFIATIGFICLSSASYAYAAIAFVNSANQYTPNETGASPISLTLNATTGNLIVVAIGVNNNGNGTCTSLFRPVDTQSNSYTQIGTSTYQSFNCLTLWYAKNITGSASLNITLGSTTPSSNANVIAEQFSGVDTTSPLDLSKKGTAAASPITSASFSTSQASEVVVMDVDNYYNVTAWTAGLIGGNGSTIDANASTTAEGDGGMSQAMEYYITGSTISGGTAAMSQTSASHYNDYVVAAFIAAGGGAPSSSPMLFDTALACLE